MHKTSLAAAAGLAAILLSTSAMAGKDLDAIKARGALICGVGTGIGGLHAAPTARASGPASTSIVCRAVAAAIFGDAEKVKYVPTDRAAALHRAAVGRGRHAVATTRPCTLTRDTALGLDFTGVTYYDGQGFMVTKKLGVKSAKELNGATVCVAPGTTTELNLADYFRANKMTFKPVVIEKVEEDPRRLLLRPLRRLHDRRLGPLRDPRRQRAAAGHADDFIILPEIISKEPLGPVVRHGDNQFADIVRWAQYAMIEAEEYGITSKNVDEMLKSDNPTIKRILGVTPGMGKALGVDEKWVYNIVKQVGNYGESFDRNVGTGSPLKIDRGLNKLWTQGGLQYAPPIR